MNNTRPFLGEKIRLMSPMNLLLMSLVLSTSGCISQKNKTTSIFDGSTLDGWKSVNTENSKYWSVVDGVITGGDGLTKIPKNTYLHTIKSYEDFEFRALFRITGNHEVGLINSGIQYRSLIEGDKIIGYQADIGKGYWGDIYDEHRRAKLRGGDTNALKKTLKEVDWNSYIVKCKGKKHELYINDVKVNEYLEEDLGIPSKGVIAIQLHSGGNAKIEFKDITILPL